MTITIVLPTDIGPSQQTDTIRCCPPEVSTLTFSQYLYGSACGARWCTTDGRRRFFEPSSTEIWSGNWFADEDELDEVAPISKGSFFCTGFDACRLTGVIEASPPPLRGCRLCLDRIPLKSAGARVAVDYFSTDGLRGSRMKRNSGMALEGARHSLNIEVTWDSDGFLIGQPVYRMGSLHTKYPRNGHGNQPYGTVVASQRQRGDNHKEPRDIHV